MFAYAMFYECRNIQGTFRIIFCTFTYGISELGRSSVWVASKLYCCFWVWIPPRTWFFCIFGIVSTSLVVRLKIHYSDILKLPVLSPFHSSQRRIWGLLQLLPKQPHTPNIWALPLHWGRICESWSAILHTVPLDNPISYYSQ